MLPIVAALALAATSVGPAEPLCADAATGTWEVVWGGCMEMVWEIKDGIVLEYCGDDLHLAWYGWIENLPHAGFHLDETYWDSGLPLTHYDFVLYNTCPGVYEGQSAGGTRLKMTRVK